MGGERERWEGEIFNVAHNHINAVPTDMPYLYRIKVRGGEGVVEDLGESELGEVGGRERGRGGEVGERER